MRATVTVEVNYEDVNTARKTIDTDDDGSKSDPGVCLYLKDGHTLWLSQGTIEQMSCLLAGVPWPSKPAPSHG